MPRISTAEREMQAAGLLPTTETEITIPEALETDEERDLYRRIVESSPSSHLFSDASEALAIQYVRHSLSSNAIAKALKSQAVQDDPKLLLALLKSQKEETMALSSLAQKLKIAPSSIATWSGNKLKRESNLPKPWEF